MALEDANLSTIERLLGGRVCVHGVPISALTILGISQLVTHRLNLALNMVQAPVAEC